MNIGIKYGFLTVVILTLTGALSDITERPMTDFVRTVYQNLPFGGQRTEIIITVDDSGIPLVDYGTIDGYEIGLQRNPVTICQNALDYFDMVEQDDKSRLYFLNCAQWLLDSSETVADTAFLRYRFPWPPYNLPSNWVSAMAQGQALQVMTRAHRFTGRTEFLRHGKRLLNAFLIDVNSGGVTYFSDTDSGQWYEEYASSAGRSSRVLNGMIITLIGLQEFADYEDDTLAANLFYKGVTALRQNLPDYDRNGHSFYDLLGNPAGSKYHRAHIDLLDSLHILTGDSLFAHYRDRWQEFDASHFLVRLATAPTRTMWAVAICDFVAACCLIAIPAIFYTRRERRKR